MTWTVLDAFNTSDLSYVEEEDTEDVADCIRELGYTVVCAEDFDRRRTGWRSSIRRYVIISIKRDDQDSYIYGTNTTPNEWEAVHIGFAPPVDVWPLLRNDESRRVPFDASPEFLASTCEITTIGNSLPADISDALKNFVSPGIVETAVGQNLCALPAWVFAPSALEACPVSEVEETEEQSWCGPTLLKSIVTNPIIDFDSSSDDEDE